MDYYVMAIIAIIASITLLTVTITAALPTMIEWHHTAALPTDLSQRATSALVTNAILRTLGRRAIPVRKKRSSFCRGEGGI